MKLILLGLAFAVTACSHTKHTGPVSPTSDSATTVKVVNDNVVDMNVFVRNEAQAFRLGRVSGGHTEVFTIPAAMVHLQTTLTFEMRPVGVGQRVRSDVVTLNPGDHITLMISP